MIPPGLVQHQGGPESGIETPHSVSEFVSLNTGQLLKIPAERGFWKYKHEALKILVRC